MCFYRACKHRWTTPLCWCVSSFQCFDVLAVIPHGALSWDVPGSSYSLASSSFRRSSLPQQNILPRARRACATRTVALPGQKRVTASTRGWTVVGWLARPRSSSHPSVDVGSAAKCSSRHRLTTVQIASIFVARFQLYVQCVEAFAHSDRCAGGGCWWCD